MTIWNYICLLICLSVWLLRLGASYRLGPCCLVPHSVPSTWHRAHRCLLNGWLLSHPTCSLVSQSSRLHLSPSVFLFLQSHFFFLTLVSHLHVSFWVCLSLSHPHLHPLPGPGTCNTFVLWLHKKEHGISQAGYHYPLLSSSSVLA